MRAAQLTTFGSPDVLSVVEVDDPSPGPDSIVIEVHAAGVNPVDHRIIAGALEGAFPHFLPIIPGWDVSGVVRAVGPSVTEWTEGDEVIGYVRSDHVAANGTYAEMVAARVRHLARKPRLVDHAAAASLPLAGLTALQSLTLADVGEGDTVLVHNASGGVGSFAVQIARLRGARVLGTASEANHDRLRDLGAEPVAYGDGLAERLAEMCPDGIDAAVDYVGTDEAMDTSFDLVGDPSRVVSITAAQTVLERGGRYCFVRPDAVQLQTLSDLVTEGALRIDVHRTFELDDVVEALQMSIDGHVSGKLALTMR